MNTTASIVSKVWSFCTTLRDDGVGYGDYLEQLTYLIFLKMAHEYSQPPYSRKVGIPAEYSWPVLKAKRGAELEVHYAILLRELGNKPGMLGAIFTKAQNKIQDPAKLYRLIDMIDETQWVTMGADVKGDIYEGLLERNAEDTKSGAGQYFTPRPLIHAMVECVRPEPGKTIADPACGTGGFFLAAYDFLVATHAMDKAQKAFLKHETFFGNEIVASTRRLALMNMFLHNIGEIDGESAISPNDALVASSAKTFDYVLANPPFGKKSSMSFTNEEGEQEKDDLTYNRQDFWATTSNKQLNFLQHSMTVLAPNGEAAVVLPDNVLFEAGVGADVRRDLMDKCRLHTILRLPTGIFYAQGVKTNVLFFEKVSQAATGSTQEVWVYDMRANAPKFGKRTPLTNAHFADFVAAYGTDPNGKAPRQDLGEQGRFRRFSREWIANERGDSLDIAWLKDDAAEDAADLPEPAVLAREAVEELNAAVAELEAILVELGEAPEAA